MIGRPHSLATRGALLFTATDRAPPTADHGSGTVHRICLGQGRSMVGRVDISDTEADRPFQQSE